LVPAAQNSFNVMLGAAVVGAAAGIVLGFLAAKRSQNYARECVAVAYGWGDVILIHTI